MATTTSPDPDTCFAAFQTANFTFSLPGVR
jgi:hypothetical protein